MMRWRTYTDRLIVLAVILAAWQLGSFFVGPYWLSSPWAVATRFCAQIWNGELIRHGGYTVEEALIGTLVGGVPARWRTLRVDSLRDPRWARVYRAFDVISPWTVGRFADDRTTDRFYAKEVARDLIDARRAGIEYMPVVFPGFSWRHGAGWASKSPLNQIPRHCGVFYQRQIDNAIKAGAQMLYTAMFDEINEGTAIFKLAVDPSQEPVGTDLFALDADGCRTANSDMYLHLAGQATQGLRRATK